MVQHVPIEINGRITKEIKSKLFCVTTANLLISAQQRKRQKISNSSINNQPSTVKELSSSPPNTITKDAESITCPTANPVSPSNEIPHVESSWTQLYQFLEGKYIYIYI